MFSEEELRTYTVRQPDGSWTRAQLGQLEEGDVIRCYNPRAPEFATFIVRKRPAMLVDRYDEDTETAENEEIPASAETCE